MPTTTADTIIATLKASGVQRIYGLAGDSLNALTDALRRDGSIAWQHVRHEETAAFAASGASAVSGRLAVCAASCGPGNLHLVNGLFDAQRSRVPVLAIASHIPSAEIGSGYFQETHPQELFRECSVYCELVGDPDQMPRVLEIAMRTALERCGVAVVVVPGDVLAAATTTRTIAPPIHATASVTRPNDEALGLAVATLDASARTTILAGAGCAGAHAQLIAVAGALQAPVVHTLRGKEHVEYDNAFDVGMTGLIGFSSGYHAMEECDTLLCSVRTSRTRSSTPETPRWCRSTSAVSRSGVEPAWTSRSSARSATPSTRCSLGCARTGALSTSNGCARTTRSLAAVSTRWPSTIAIARRCTRSTSRRSSTSSPPRTLSSSPTSAHRPCGPRATSA